MSVAGTEVAAVVIGRNEGERLRNCLRSIPAGVVTVYVDSGSSDGSVDFARSLSVEVIELDMSKGFTAARARNAGLEKLNALRARFDFVQMIDGDCVLDSGWLPKAVAALENDEKLGVVFGRRRERFPERSVYNRMCDDEWNVPIGLANACGGDALFRAAPLLAAGGYDPSLIAGEEPDLCLRLRAAGWQILRIDEEMTLHDAAITRFSQWWKRAKRSGHAYAEHLWRHRANADPVWRRQVVSIALWGFALPLAALLLSLAGIALKFATALRLVLAVAALYPLQWARMALRKRNGGVSSSFSAKYAALILAGKFAEFTGVLTFMANLARKRRSSLIEYKQSGA